MKNIVITLVIILGTCGAYASKSALDNESTVAYIAKSAGVHKDKLIAHLQEKNIIEKVTEKIEEMHSDPPFICIRLSTGEYHTITPEVWQKMALNPRPQDLETTVRCFYKKKKMAQERTKCTIL